MTGKSFLKPRFLGTDDWDDCTFLVGLWLLLCVGVHDMRLDVAQSSFCCSLAAAVDISLLLPHPTLTLHLRSHL